MNVSGSLEFVNVGHQEGDVSYTVKLPNLRMVDRLSFSNMGLLEMPQFDALESVRSLSFQDVTFTDSDTTNFDKSTVPELKSAISVSFTDTTLSGFGELPPGFSLSSGTINILNNPYLATIDFGALSFENPPTINIRNNPNCGSVAVGVAQADSVVIFNNSATTSVIFSDLTSVQKALQLESNVDLSNIQFNGLNSVGSLIVANNPGLTGLSFPQLSAVADRLAISGDIAS